MDARGDKEPNAGSKRIPLEAVAGEFAALTGKPIYVIRKRPLYWNDRRQAWSPNWDEATLFSNETRATYKPPEGSEWFDTTRVPRLKATIIACTIVVCAVISVAVWFQFG
jgi:hypothetical protein